MKILVTAALALGLLGLAPAGAQAPVTTTTTTVRAPGIERTVVTNRPNGTRVIRRTVMRTNNFAASSYGRRHVARRSVCSMRYRGNKRLRTCRTIVRR